MEKEEVKSHQCIKQSLERRKEMKTGDIVYHKLDNRKVIVVNRRKLSAEGCEVCIRFLDQQTGNYTTDVVHEAELMTTKREEV